MRKFLLIVVLPILIFGGGLLYLNIKKEAAQKVNQTTTQQISTAQRGNGGLQTPITARWEFDGTNWRLSGKPPACPSPLLLSSPVDSDSVSSILYPGQTRSNDYKSHGGFGFSSNTNNNVVVKAPIEAQLVKGSRYIEQGEVQYLLVFINQCGIVYKFDHLLKLAPKYQEAMNKLPQPKANDSHTIALDQVDVLAGEVISTQVGFKNTKTVAFDFGVYDLRRKNEANTHDKEYSPYGVCWLTLFSKTTSQLLKTLPARDAASGKKSDYCK